MSDIPPPPGPRKKGAFAALFDNSFEYFVTPVLLEVGYLLLVIVSAVAAAGSIVVALNNGDVLVVPGILIGLVLWLMVSRVAFEVIERFFVMADDIRELRRRGEGL